MKILTIVGARPQFVKASVVSRAIAERSMLKEVILHTGQHYDHNMSNVFFRELRIPAPDYQLDINGGSHGKMTGQMLMEIEQVVIEERPDWLLVYGDTNSTLAGALAASKLHVPIAHVEAGLRSFERGMPEEINRVLTDRLGSLLLCPSETAVKNLGDEGILNTTSRVVNVGDVMFDCSILFGEFARRPSGFCHDDVKCKLQRSDVAEQGFILCTLHRAENTENPERLREIAFALNSVHQDVAPVIMPVHPRTRIALEKHNISLNVICIDPVSYLEMLWLIRRSGLVITDSGGLQKEAFFFGRYCVTTRDQTEWTELLAIGANVLVGANKARIFEESVKYYGRKAVFSEQPYGKGNAAQLIVDEMCSAM